MAENVPNSGKETHPDRRSQESTEEDESIEIRAETHYDQTVRMSETRRDS